MNGRMYDPSGENGNEPQGNSSGNHGSPGGGGSVEVKPIGNGKYEVVNGLNDGGNTVYVVDDQGNRTGEILGYTLTPYTFYNEKGVFVESAIIDMNDYSGQDFWDEFLSDTPSLFTYIFDKENGGRRGGYYDFKAHNPNKTYDGMLVDFGFGDYIATPRDIGNFTAGYLSGVNGLTYESTRSAFDAYQILTDGHIEPPVSRSAQNIGYNWGFHIFHTYWMNLLFH